MEQSQLRVIEDGEFGLSLSLSLIISSLCMFLFSKKFYTSFTHIYIHCDILSIHLEITEVRSKRRVYFYCQNTTISKTKRVKGKKTKSSRNFHSIYRKD